MLIYDLGGGTLDVTVLELFDGVLEVKSSSGDNKLGGKDFDSALIDYITDRFNKANDVDIIGIALLSIQMFEYTHGLSFSN